MPEDPMILLSYVNTKLRDEYVSFDELCRSMSADADVIKNRLAAVGFTYDETLNRFV